MSVLNVFFGPKVLHKYLILCSQVSYDMRIWICTCVHLLLYITVAAYSSEIGNPITDDIRKISLLKQNIPKDYKITVRYIPKEVSDMCWVKLNVFHLEVSLKGLAQKFGNISSNKDNIGTFVKILQEMRYHIGQGLEVSMLEFECHYVEEMWLTAKYFEYVEDFFNTANSSREAEDCDPPPCPTSTKTTVTTTTTMSPTSAQHSTNGEAHVITSLKGLCTKAWTPFAECCLCHFLMKLLRNCRMSFVEDRPFATEVLDVNTRF
ncbi:kit ligand [Pimephales promelas]|nr:kit ligand [Pimephales promelas]